jgi:hypothetical protein
MRSSIILWDSLDLNARHNVRRRVSVTTCELGLPSVRNPGCALSSPPGGLQLPRQVTRLPAWQIRSRILLMTWDSAILLFAILVMTLLGHLMRCRRRG